MVDLLQVALEERFKHTQTDGGTPMTKRSLMRSANLNHTQLTNYLGTLEKKGFVITEENSAGLFVEITDSGLEFLEQAEHTLACLDRD